MRVLIALGGILLIALGVAAVIAGEADDSPGLQGLGVLIVLATAVALWRRRRGGVG